MIRKIVLLVSFSLLSLFGLTNVFAKNKVGWEGTTSGDYIIYKDASWKDEAYLGFLYYNSTSIGSFLYIPSRSLRATVLFSFEDSDGELVLTGQKITSARSNDDLYVLAINYLMDILPSLYKEKIKPSKKNGVIKRGEKVVNTEQFGPSCTFNYASFLPFFYLESVFDEKGREMLILEKIGHISNDDDKPFFSFEPIIVSNDSKKNYDFLIKDKAKKETRVVEGITFTLDSQWKQIADNAFFMENVAFLNINKVSEKAFTSIPDASSFFVKLFSMSGINNKVLYEKSELSERKNGIVIKTVHYDAITKEIIKDIKTIVKQGKDYVVISLTVPEVYYIKYKKYFESLF